MGRLACEVSPGPQDSGVGAHHRHQGRDHQHDPDRLGPHLELGQQGHAKDDERNDDQGHDQVAHGQGYPEGELEGLGHDRSLEGEEDEREAGVDERRDRRAEVPEPCASGEQVHVDRVLGRVVSDGDASEEDRHRGGHDGPHRAGETSGHGDGAADGIVSQIGDAPQSGGGHHVGAPLAKGTRRVAKGVILHRLALGQGTEAPADTCLPRCPSTGRALPRRMSGSTSGDGRGQGHERFPSRTGTGWPGTTWTVREGDFGEISAV